MANQIKLNPDGEADIEITPVGFKFGALTVDRMCTLPRGVVCVRMETPSLALNIRVTKTGKLRIYTDSGIEVMVSR